MLIRNWPRFAATIISFSILLLHILLRAWYQRLDEGY